MKSGRDLDHVHLVTHTFHWLHRARNINSWEELWLIILIIIYEYTQVVSKGKNYSSLGIIPTEYT